MPDNTMPDRNQSHVVVIGGGWAGWGAAKSLCEAGVDVTLIDGMLDPTGSQPITTKSGKPFEAGTREALSNEAAQSAWGLMCLE
jgi:protoporphyrinogen oxidase